jgi:hypothetical protein
MDERYETQEGGGTEEGGGESGTGDEGDEGGTTPA